MTSLVFRALDRHIVDGRADKLAIDDGAGSMTYAQLLAQTAALAGGLANVGVTEGTHVSLGVEGSTRVSAVLACARLGAIPDPEATFRIAGEPPGVHTGEHDYTWATVLSAGKTDPMPAPERDHPDYEPLMLEQFKDIFETLIAGKTLTQRTP